MASWLSPVGLLQGQRNKARTNDSARFAFFYTTEGGYSTVDPRALLGLVYRSAEAIARSLYSNQRTALIIWKAEPLPPIPIFR